MKGRENIALLVTGYMVAINVWVKASTGSKLNHLLSNLKAVTTGAATSKNASVSSSY